MVADTQGTEVNMRRRIQQGKNQIALKRKRLTRAKQRKPVHDLLVRLALRATDHVAPYRRLELYSTSYWDAMRVVKAYRKNELAFIPLSVHERLAAS